MVLCIFISSFSPIHHPSAFSHSTSPASCPENRCDYSSCVFWCRCRNDSSPWLWYQRTGTWLAPSPWISHRHHSRFPWRRCHIPFLQGQRHCQSILLMALILMILVGGFWSGCGHMKMICCWHMLLHSADKCNCFAHIQAYGSQTILYMGHWQMKVKLGLCVWQCKDRLLHVGAA